MVPGAPNIPKIPLGFATDLTVKPLPSGQHGLRLILGNGDPVYCNAPRTLWFDMMCDPTAPATAPPNTTMYGNFDIVSIIFCVISLLFLSSMPPHTRDARCGVRYLHSARACWMRTLVVFGYYYYCVFFGGVFFVYFFGCLRLHLSNPKLTTTVNLLYHLTYEP